LLKIKKNNSQTSAVSSMRGQVQISKGSFYDLSSDGLSLMQKPGET